MQWWVKAAEQGIVEAELNLGWVSESGEGVVPQKIQSQKQGSEDRILRVVSFRDPAREIDKLTELYESLSGARREVGEEPVLFHLFAELVQEQTKKLRQGGSPGVAFCLAVIDGKIRFTARALKKRTSPNQPKD